jgi:GNAT superfamily N-acetyltransferase
MKLDIGPLRNEERDAWQPLAQGYMDFYKTQKTAEDFDTTWSRLMRQDGIRGLGARADGQLIGIAHYFFHTAVWARTVCYLQDLFVAPQERGHGVARALIEAVAAEARAHHAARFYWLTQDHNSTARALYDKVAQHKGFIRYDYPLE